MNLIARLFVDICKRKRVKLRRKRIEIIRWTVR